MVLPGPGVVCAPQLSPFSSHLSQPFHARPDGAVRSAGARVAQRQRQRDRHGRLRPAERPTSPARRQPTHNDPARRSALPPAPGQTNFVSARLTSYTKDTLLSTLRNCL